jgi:alanyl-tRNA synthetase
MTEKLYFDDQYLQEFSSTVAQNIDAGERPGVILAQTLFYPASGGQPHDTGTLNGIPVIDVIEDSKQGIIHFLTQPLKVGEVIGRINWDRRFDHMQQHTGQHLLSQAFMKLCDAATISFHMGDESATLDLNLSGVSVETLTAVEDLANRIVYENRTVTSRVIDKQDLPRYPMRKPPAVDKNIRIIEIEDFDYSPCGGTHCSKTGEIGIIKIRRFENYKGGGRIHFLCGGRALKDYREKSIILKQIGESLSAGESDLYKNIIKNQDELKALRRESNNLKKQYLDVEAQALFSDRKKIENINIIVKLFEDRDPADLKILARKVLKNSPGTVILFGANSAAKASLLFLRSEEIDCDMGKLMQNACSIIDGRGGGRPQQAQGGGPAADKLDEALQWAYNSLPLGRGFCKSVTKIRSIK